MHTDERFAVVTYLFRTTGQVLGVSLSGAILQAVLLQKLRERIQGPGSDAVGYLFAKKKKPCLTSVFQLIYDIRYSPTSTSRTLRQ